MGKRKLSHFDRDCTEFCQKCKKNSLAIQSHHMSGVDEEKLEWVKDNLFLDRDACLWAQTTK